MKNTSLMLQKTAVRFAKTGPAVYHSHHDMIRFWERAVKRAGLPVRFTQGFNPHLRLVFPHALGLGIASRREEVELELYESVPLPEVVERVRSAAGDTLDILDAVELPPVKKSRLLSESSYRITGWTDSAPPLLEKACADLLARPEVVVERGAPDKRRTMDIRPYLLSVEFASADSAVLARLRHTLEGAARADEVARLLAGAVGTDPRDLFIEKTGMVLE
jgi:radical SAM-linked protein